MQINRTQSQPSFKSVRFRNPDQLMNYARNREFTKILNNAERAARMPAQFQIQYMPSLEHPLWVACTKESASYEVNRLHRQEVPIYKLSQTIDDLYEAAEKEHCSPIAQIPNERVNHSEREGFWNLMRANANGAINLYAADTLLEHLNKTSIKAVLEQLKKITKPERPSAELFLGFNPKRQAPFSVGCLDRKRFTAGVVFQNLQTNHIAHAAQEALERAQEQAFAPPKLKILDLTLNAQDERRMKLMEIEAINQRL